MFSPSKHWGSQQQIHEDTKKTSTLGTHYQQCSKHRGGRGHYPVNTCVLRHLHRHDVNTSNHWRSQKPTAFITIS
jgi:hypothetical protein